MKCRFLCFADTHNGPRPPIPQIRATAWFHAGDFYTADDDLWQLQQGAGASSEIRCRAEAQAKMAEQWLQGIPVPAYAVRGNHDIDDPLGFFGTWQDVSGRLVKLSPGLFLAGVGWHGESGSDLPGEAELGPICKGLLRQIWRNVRASDRLIVLSHYFPAVPEAPSVGLRVSGLNCLTELIVEVHPTAFVYGHLHEDFGSQWLFRYEGGETLIVNPGPTGGILTVEARLGTAQFTAIAKQEERRDGSRVRQARHRRGDPQGV